MNDINLSLRKWDYNKMSITMIKQKGLSRELVKMINTKLTTTGDHYTNLSDALEILCRQIGAVRGIIKLYSRFDNIFVQDIVWPDGSPTSEENVIAQRVIDCGSKPYFYAGMSSDHSFNEPIMGLPLENNGYPLGVAVFKGETQEELRVFLQSDLQNYLPLLVIPAENMLLHRVLISSYLRTIESLALALEAKDNYTIGHSNMVMAHALAIANSMKLNKQSLDAIEIGALMHDIGKIGVRDEVLQKSEGLSDSEFSEMRQHPIIGEQILQPLNHDVMNLPRKIVRWHHEQINGGGYPDSITGDSIPIEVKIVSVADIFEALTSDRPYRAALDIKEALLIIIKLVPDHLDVEVVSHLEKLMYPSINRL